MATELEIRISNTDCLHGKGGVWLTRLNLRKGKVSSRD